MWPTPHALFVLCVGKRNAAQFSAAGPATAFAQPRAAPEPPAPPLCPAGIAGASHFAHVDGLSVAAGVLGVFLAVQASRVQFVFDDEALEVGVSALKLE